VATLYFKWTLHITCAYCSHSSKLCILTCNWPSTKHNRKSSSYL